MSRRHAFIIPGYGKRNQQGNVLGITHNPSTRTAAGSVLCLRAAIAVLLGMLVLAAAARAEPVTQAPTEATSEPTQGVPSGETPPETAAPVSGETPQETAAPVNEVLQEAAAPVSEPPPEQAPVTPVKETVTEVIVPVQEAAGPVTPILEQEILPLAPVIERVSEVVQPSSPVSGQAEEVAPGASSTVLSAETSPLPGAGVSQAGGPPPPGASSVLALTEAASAPTVVPPLGLASSSPAKASVAAPLRLTAAQRAEDLSCQLSGLSGAATADCTAGRSGIQSSSSGPAAFAVGATTTTGSGTPPGGGYGGSTGGTRTVAPPPGPAPSGAFGGSAAGGSGIALSGFFKLAGLLLMAAPLAMRRLRLSCRPWLTAFFVLIPERPG